MPDQWEVMSANAMWAEHGQSEDSESPEEWTLFSSSPPTVARLELSGSKLQEVTSFILQNVHVFEH